MSTRTTAFLRSMTRPTTMSPTFKTGGVFITGSTRTVRSSLLISTFPVITAYILPLSSYVPSPAKYSSEAPIRSPGTTISVISYPFPSCPRFNTRKLMCDFNSIDYRIHISYFILMKLKGMCNGELHRNCVSNAMRLNEVPHEAIYYSIVKQIDDLTYAYCLTQKRPVAAPLLGSERRIHYYGIIRTVKASYVTFQPSYINIERLSVILSDLQRSIV